MFILKKGHQPGVYVPLRALFLVNLSSDLSISNLFVLFITFKFNSDNGADWCGVIVLFRLLLLQTILFVNFLQYHNDHKKYDVTCKLNHTIFNT